MAGEHILVVDDSPTVQKLITTMLASGGYKDVLTAADGKEALEIAAAAQPGLVLLDVILPKLNGYQVCRQLKSTAETAHIAVVMITRKSKDTDRLWGIEQGANAYITKPFDAEELLAVVGRHVPDTVRRDNER
jgi:twitching motility two-component system response regulator PilH